VGAQSTVSTIPAQLVRCPAGSVLYFRIAVTGAAATLLSFLPGGVLPTIPVLNVSGPAGTNYAFKFTDLQSETDPATAAVRYTDDGQTVPSATLGFIVPGGASFVRIPCDPQDIKLFSVGGGTVNIQVKLGIMGLTTAGN
jgi:hypothetical protein